MTESEPSPTPLELETLDGRPIAYIGPHASLIPQMKSIICPLIGICMASEISLRRPLDHVKKEFEWLLQNNASFMLKVDGRFPHLIKRGLQPEKIIEIANSIIRNAENMSSYMVYKHASVQQSGQLSGFSPMWGVSSLPQTSAEQFPVLEEGEYRNLN